VNAVAVLGLLLAVAGSATIAAPTAGEPPRARHEVHVGHDLAAKLADDAAAATDAPEAAPLLATLVQTHTDERVPLDRDAPPLARFEGLLADRATGSEHAVDARLLGLLRALAARHQDPVLGAPRIEIVSGYRSPKLNEMLRKKGHHVASHSQHSLGHAVDFRIVPAGAAMALDPRVVEKEIRALGWDGGVGTYPTKDDWFVHADVGPDRHWVN
jgi:uncharacterized protein YcbK (DUF882 family)